MLALVASGTDRIFVSAPRHEAERTLPLPSLTTSVEPAFNRSGRRP